LLRYSVHVLKWIWLPVLNLLYLFKLIFILLKNRKLLLLCLESLHFCIHWFYPLDWAFNCWALDCILKYSNSNPSYKFTIAELRQNWSF
jgi:hypothetical protein